MEQFWTELQGFEDVVKDAWLQPVQSEDRIKRLHINVSRTCRALKKWGNTIKRKNGLMAAIASELDLAQEDRELSEA